MHFSFRSAGASIQCSIMQLGETAFNLHMVLLTQKHVSHLQLVQQNMKLCTIDLAKGTFPQTPFLTRVEFWVGFELELLRNMPCPIKPQGYFTSLSLVNDTSSDYTEVMQRQSVAGATLIWGNKTTRGKKKKASHHYIKFLKWYILIKLPWNCF